MAAATGVLAVLLASGGIVWRVVGTGFTTAFASGLMLGVSRLIDHQKLRSAGLLGMGAVIIEFLMVLALIWEVPRNVWGLRCEEQIALTVVFFGLGVVLIMSFQRLLHEPCGIVAGRVGEVVTLAMFVACMMASWVDLAVFNDDWWETAGVIALFGGLATLNLVNVGTGDHRHWRWAGIMASVIAGGMWLMDIWVGAGSDLGAVFFCGLIGFAAVSAHANLSLVGALKPGQIWVRGVTIGAAVLTAGFVELIIISDLFSGMGVADNLLSRLAAAAGIVTGCGTLALCVLLPMNRKVAYEAIAPELNEVTLICPRCRKKQPIRTGDSACSACGLRISIRVDEPRCPQCDYLLYGLTSDRCPECGVVFGAKASGE